MKKITIITLAFLLTILLFISCGGEPTPRKTPVTGVMLNKDSTTILEHEIETLVATVLPENATNKNVTWKSSNDDIAKVDENGKVTGVAVGEATITVTTEDGGFTATCDVTVNLNANYIPLTFEALNDETEISFSTITSALKYTKTGSSPVTTPTVVAGPITINKGETVSLYRTLTESPSSWLMIFCDKDCYVYGNVMSLYAENGFENLTTISYQNAFRNLFCNNIYIKNHDSIDLVLPATTLANSCYAGMFSGCTSLTTAPTLSATNLAYSCYHQMFSDCTSLETAPALPATTLTTFCYSDMFNGCTSLTKAPDLPAATLTMFCYLGMFYNCTKLNSITCLATDISAVDCTHSWVNGVAASGTFTKAAGVDWGEKGVSRIPSGWTVQDYPTN